MEPDASGALALGAARGGDVALRGPERPARWFRGGQHFRLEAALFLAVVLTFALILFGDSIREKRFDLTDSKVQLFPYGYSDGDSGGASSLRIEPGHAFGWSCTLAPKVQFPYCGYGLEVEGARQSGKGLDLSDYDSVTLSLVYRGAPTRLRLALRNFDPAYSTANNDQSTMPVVAEFAVKDGLNVIELPRDKFRVEQWWLDQNKFPGGEPALDLRSIVAVDFISAEALPGTYGTFTVAIESIAFSGIMLTTAQWHLLILGIWMVLTGVFLVYRFFAVRRGFEKRQRIQARESRELAQARAAAEAASEAKSQFLANMSHELRTPLNAILGYAQLLDREALNERQKAAVSTIHQSGSHLLTLITDILDLSKIEAGKLDLLPAQFDLHACVAHVSNMIRLRTEEKGLRFTVELSEDLPQQIVGDAKRIRQILLNLLGNAVKFTAAGEVRLDVSVASWEGGNVRLRFDVTDTGTGIAESQIDRLFEPFEQAGTAIDRSGGTGLGLSITRQLVRAMNGDVKVQSRVGQGTCFTAEVEGSLASPLAPAERGEPLALARAVRVLVVDDDTATGEFLCKALADLGAIGSTAESGAAALEACAQQRPDLIFMDLKMPGMNGLAAIRKMKLSPELRDLPIIAITGSAAATCEADALAAGAARLLQKPIDLETLAECVTQTKPEIAAPPENNGSDMKFAHPSAHQLERLLILARAGNMRGVQKEAQSLAECDPGLRPFAQRLCELAASYQSPAVLRLVEHNLNEREAA